MRDAPGELPDGLHLLGLTELFLRLGELRLVAKTLSDIVDEIIGSDAFASLIPQCVELNFVVWSIPLRISEIFDDV